MTEWDSKKHKNEYDDLVDGVDELVMYGAQVSCVIASSIGMITIPKLPTTCHE